VRAPDDVRRAIEAWVAAEGDCRIALDVRAIPTDGGLYLLARDSNGLLHERLVPDAQSAGVLVASWVANDSIQPAPTPPPPPHSTRAPVAPRPRDLALEKRDVEPETRTLAIHAAMEDPPRSANPSLASLSSWLGTPWGGLGASMWSNEVTGAHAHGGLDILRDRGLGMGVLIGESFARFKQDSVSYFRNDLRGLAVLSLGYSGGPWLLRTQIGVGMIWSHILHTGSDAGFGLTMPGGDWIGSVFDVSFRVGRKLTNQSSLGLGPTGTWYGGGQWDSGDISFAPGKAEYGVRVDITWGI
jgi:hypothetical protein